MYKDESLWGTGRPERIEVCLPAALGRQLGLPSFYFELPSSYPVPGWQHS